MIISREVFDRQRRPRFGTNNPSRMTLEFWEWMIQYEPPIPSSAPSIRKELGLTLDEGVMKSTYGPWKARQAFNISRSEDRENGPIWTFDRDGRSVTDLPDGRVVCVGGEHEDSYDQDFAIYNDVVILADGGEVEIYGYPREVFPPTDFHTATLVDDHVVMIGCLGYPEDRKAGSTPVYDLDLSDMSIREVVTWGEGPGWLHGHEAEQGNRGRILVRGGEFLTRHRGDLHFLPNFDEYLLNVGAKSWERLTRRAVHIHEIRREDGEGLPEDDHDLPEALIPDLDLCSPTENEDEPERFMIAGVSASISVGTASVRIVIGDAVAHDLTQRVLESVKETLETRIRQRCVLERFYP